MDAKLVLHLAGCVEVEPGPINADALRRALRLTRWYRYEAGRLHRLLGRERVSNDERRVRELPDPFKLEDVQAAWNVKRRQAYNVIKRLERDSLIERVTKGVYRPCTPYTFPLDPPENENNLCKAKLHIDCMVVPVGMVKGDRAIKVNGFTAQKTAQNSPRRTKVHKVQEMQLVGGKCSGG